MNNRKKIGFLVTLIAFLLILGIKSQVLNVYADSTTQIECNPEVVRICSVCGNNYDDGSVCSHHIDEMYNGTICEPEGGQICTICNGNYATCSHHEGDSYGGEVCTTYECCNVCGNDYHDGSVCSHHKGESYGGEVCEVYLTTICNICGNNYNDSDVCAHQTGGYYYDYDDVCEPYDIDICSICGNDYNDSEACQHYIGEVYNEVVCTTTNICSICGNDYYGSACSHYQGETYGSTECGVTSGRICNICNNNYDDANVCSHYEGVMYDGEICSTSDIRTCNICGNNYDDGNVCQHHIGNSYQNVAYIFYLPYWYEATKFEQKKICDYYGLEKEHVVLVEINNIPTFKNAWDNIGYLNGELVNTVSVIIDTHANSKILAGTEWTIANSETIEQLTPKKVGRLILLGCNAGHLDNKNDNPANNFAKKVYGAPVVASDGTVVSSYRDVFVFWDTIAFESINDVNFKDDSIYGERENIGWIIYQYIDNKIFISESYGKTLTLIDMLEITEF